MGRTATEPLSIGGSDIAAGDFLVLLYASGNRDEAAFGPTADQLDVTRPVDTTHVAFGFGEHLCLGASLARLEARVMFEELLRGTRGTRSSGRLNSSAPRSSAAPRALPVVLK